MCPNLAYPLGMLLIHVHAVNHIMATERERERVLSCDECKTSLKLLIGVFAHIVPGRSLCRLRRDLLQCVFGTEEHMLLFAPLCHQLH